MYHLSSYGYGTLPLDNKGFGELQIWSQYWLRTCVSFVEVGHHTPVRHISKLNPQTRSWTASKKVAEKAGENSGGKWAVATRKAPLRAGSPKGNRTHVSAVRGRGMP